MRQYGARLEAILDRATTSVVREQAELGIDIPTNGEIRRENYIHYHCRKLAGIDFEMLTESEMRGHYQARLPTITGAIQAAREPFVVRDWQVAQSATNKPVKIPLPRPLTIGDSIADAFHQDPRVRGAALADALDVEIRRLADAGCPVIEVDEPVFARQTEAALAFGLEHLERCFHKVERSAERVVHVCCGYPDRLDNEDYPKAPNGAYLELADGLDEIAIDAVAIARSRVEAAGESGTAEAGTRAHRPRASAGAPDCGLGLLGRDLARQKLQVLTEAAHSL